MSQKACLRVSGSASPPRVDHWSALYLTPSLTLCSFREGGVRVHEPCPRLVYPHCNRCLHPGSLPMIFGIRSVDMDLQTNRDFGYVIGRLINKQDLTENEAYIAFCHLLANRVTEMQQGAFLAALTAKGETAAEVAGGWRAVHELDTNTVDFGGLKVVDNCGTGMDSFKTFNISTAASVVAAACGLKVARHGARAITSACGTVDMAERLGVDVECDVDTVAHSVREAGVGLFNGMSPAVHPMALGRILSQIAFGSPLNIAASLAHPAMPKVALRGVYTRKLLKPVAEVMHAIGYTDALVVHGLIDNTELGMDEASVSGTTYGAWLQNGRITYHEWRPEDCGLTLHSPSGIAADTDPELGARRMCSLLAGQGPADRNDAVVLNCALLLLVSGETPDIRDGVAMSRDALSSGRALSSLQRWVSAQNRNPEAGLRCLNELCGASMP